MGYERSELQIFCCENVSLRRYGSFNGLVVLWHLKSLMSAERSQKLTMLFYSQTHQEFLYLYNKSHLGLSASFVLKFAGTKTGENHLEMAILVSDAHFKIIF